MKFYYNPVNGKFEPVAYDGHRMIPGNYNEYEFNWNKGLWEFPSFGPSSFEKQRVAKY